MNRPLWKEKSLVEQDDRTQQGLPFVFLLVTFRSIWRKWQRSCCIHFLLVVWVEWLKCGVPLDGEAIRVRHCLCIWFSDQYVGPNGDSHSTFILERELFRDVVPDKKKSLECSILGKFQMVSEAEPFCRRGNVVGRICSRIMTWVACWGQWSFGLFLHYLKLLGQAGIREVHSG